MVFVVITTMILYSYELTLLNVVCFASVQHYMGL